MGLGAVVSQSACMSLVLVLAVFALESALEIASVTLQTKEMVPMVSSGLFGGHVEEEN